MRLKQSQKQGQSFMGGTMLLSMAGLICKILGFFLTRGLSNKYIGSISYSFYMTAYLPFTLLVAISTAGLPSAIAHMVSTRRVRGDYAGAQKVLSVAVKILFIGGLVCTAVMIAGAPLFNNLRFLSKPEEANGYLIPSYIALAPSLFFVAVLCAYRGFFQGMSDMRPTAISQIIEQAVQFVLVIAIFGFFMKIPLATTEKIKQNPELLPIAYNGSFYAILTVTASEAVAMVVIWIQYRRHLPHLRTQIQNQPEEFNESSKVILKQLLILAAPLILASPLMPVKNWIDRSLLDFILGKQKVPDTMISDLYGACLGSVQPILFAPAVISVALSVSLIPSISEGMLKKDAEGLERRTRLAYKIALIVSIPCCFGLMALADPVMRTVYDHEPWLQKVDVQMMRHMAPSLIFLGLMQTGNGILQGMGKMRVTVYNLIAALSVSIIWGLSLFSSNIGALGMAMSSIACYAVAAGLNIINIAKYSRGHFNFKIGWRDIATPLAAGLLMAIGVSFLYGFLHNTLNMRGSGLIIAIGFGAVIYLAALILLGGLSAEDLAMIPGGKYLRRFVKIKN